MRLLPTIAMVMTAATAAAAHDVPLPRPRPATLAPTAAPTVLPEPSPCQLRLAVSDRAVRANAARPTSCGSTPS
jgi:hypothetical protein